MELPTINSDDPLEVVLQAFFNITLEELKNYHDADTAAKITADIHLKVIAVMITKHEELEKNG